MSSFHPRLLNIVHSNNLLPLYYIIIIIYYYSLFIHSCSPTSLLAVLIFKDCLLLFFLFFSIMSSFRGFVHPWVALLLFPLLYHHPDRNRKIPPCKNNITNYCSLFLHHCHHAHCFFCNILKGENTPLVRVLLPAGHSSHTN